MLPMRARRSGQTEKAFHYPMVWNIVMFHVSNIIKAQMEWGEVTFPAKGVKTFHHFDRKKIKYISWSQCVLNESHPSNVTPNTNTAQHRIPWCLPWHQPLKCGWQVTVPALKRIQRLWPSALLQPWHKLQAIHLHPTLITSPLLPSLFAAAWLCGLRSPSDQAVQTKTMSRD